MKENARGKNSRGSVLVMFLNNKAIFLLFLVLIVASFAHESFLTERNILNVLRQCSATIVLAAALTCLLSTGCIDLSAGYMTGLLGILAATLSKKSGLSPVVVILLVLAFGAGFGCINGLIIKKFRINFFITTLATGMIFQGINYLICGNATITGIPEWLKYIGSGYVGSIPFPILLALFVVIVMAVVFYWTPLGRHFIAVGGNAKASQMSGINVDWVHISAYILVGVCAAVTALILTGRAQAAQPSAGQGYELDGIAAVVIGGTALAGGKGNPIGTVFGCLLVGVISNMLNLLAVNSNWQYVVKGAMILFAVGLDVATERIFARRLVKS